MHLKLTNLKHDKFLIFIQPMFDLLSILLRQSGIMKYLTNKLLNESWKFEGRLESMVKNHTRCCVQVIFVHIYWVFDLPTHQFNLNTLCDNTIGRLQWSWVAEIVDKNLVSWQCVCKLKIMFYLICDVIFYDVSTNFLLTLNTHYMVKCCYIRLICSKRWVIYSNICLK